MPVFDFTGPDGSRYTVTGPDGATPEQAFAILQNQLHNSQAPQSDAAAVASDQQQQQRVLPDADIVNHLGQTNGTAPQPQSSSWGDFWKSIPSGILASLAGTAAASGQAGMLETGDSDAAATMPNAQQAQDTIEQNVTGPLHNPEGAAGRIGETIGEFVGNPATYVAPGGVLKNAAQAGIAGAASALAGEATKGTGIELPARVAAAMLMPSSLGSKADAAIPSNEALRSAADAGYDAARSTPVYIKPSSASQWAGGTAVQLARDGFNDKLAPNTHDVLDELQSVPSGAAVSMDNLDTARKTLSNIASAYNNPTEQAAASRAIRSLDDYVTGLSPSDVLSGDAGTAANLWADARGNYAAAKRADTVSDAMNAASLNTDAGNYGNLNNAVRQQFKRVLTSHTAGRGFSPDELDQMERVVRGTTTGNLLRTIGKLGGGGPMQAVAMGLGGYAGSQSDQPGGTVSGAILPLIIGTLARRGANASTMRQVSALDQMVRGRSPLAQAAISPLSAVNDLRTSRSLARRLLNSAIAVRTGQQQ